MKKLLLIVAIGSGILLSGNFAYAGSENTGENMVAKDIEKASGHIVAIDAISNTLTLKEAATKVSYMVEKDAKININGKAMKLSELKIGEKVTVHYKMEGEEKVIVSIK